METVLITAPQNYPVTLAEAKAHMNIAVSDDDTYIRSLIATATDRAEQFTRRRLITQTWKAFFDEWPDEYFDLPFGQLQSVTAVKYKDSNGDESTLSTDDYIVNTVSLRGRVVLGYGKSWPSTTLYPSNPISVEFVCGYFERGNEWEASTVYAENVYVQPSTENGLAYYCSTAGTSDASEPSWPYTIGGTVADGTAAWTSAGMIVPGNIRSAILITISDLYENREDKIIGTITSEFNTAVSFLTSYIIKAW